MTLSTEIKDKASVSFIRITDACARARKHFDDSERHFHERHKVDGRRSLLAASTAMREAGAELEEMRKILGLDDPKVIQKKTLDDRAKRTVADLAKATSRKTMMVDDGETDQNILNAIDQVIARYESALQGLSREMSESGWAPEEILAACGKA